MKKIRKKIYHVLLAVFVSVFCTIHAADASGPISLKASSFLPKNHPLGGQIQIWIDTINTQLKDTIIVKYVGGPEVIPDTQQIEAVKKGIIDISFTAGAHYGTQVEVANSFHLSKLMPWEERESGYYDLINDEHKKLGVRYLGRWLYGPFYMWLEKPIKGTEDLKGRRLRTHPLYDRFYRAIGISAITIPTSEIYTALERGLIEGTSWPIEGPRENGWAKYLKYIIKQPFYGQNNCVILMNIETWNRIPDDTKQKIVEITTSFEKEMVAYFQKRIDTEWNLVIKEGVTPIELSPVDAKLFQDNAYGAEWADLEKKIPNLVEQLKKTSGN